MQLEENIVDFNRVFPLLIGDLQKTPVSKVVRILRNSGWFLEGQRLEGSHVSRENRLSVQSPQGEEYEQGQFTRGKENNCVECHGDPHKT
jgi:hypothetical protein